jgi:hypothetical protein
MPAEVHSMSKVPKDDKDDAADALAAFAAGEHHDDTPAGSGVEGHAHVDLGPGKPVQPPAVPASPAKPLIPAAPPRSRVPGPPPQRPAAPPTAANPMVPARPPPAAPARPMSPAPGAGAQAGLSHEQEVAREAEGLAHVVEDDDTLNMPAPTADMIAYRRPAPPPRKRVQLSRTVGFKQTIIPTLLTLGVLLPALALWSFLLGEESPVHGANWIPLTLAGIGVVMLAFAVVTMFQVKHQLEVMKQPRA